ncbi:MAG: hypothetical protein CME06_16845, partial [Gemmatimonadetes bacterium]|nr:hypothetical protein [Gemmatimonadota bacterium]
MRDRCSPNPGWTARAFERVCGEAACIGEQRIQPTLEDAGQIPVGKRVTELCTGLFELLREP